MLSMQEFGDLIAAMPAEPTYVEEMSRRRVLLQDAADAGANATEGNATAGDAVFDTTYFGECRA